MTGLLAVDKVASVLDLVIFPLLSTLSMIHVVEPFAIVHRSVLVDENTISASLAFLPLSVIDVAVFVRNSSFTMEKSLECHSLIHRAVRELYHSKAFPCGLVLVSFPLTLILSTFANINQKGVPVVAFSSSLRTQLVSKILIREQRLLSSHQLALQVNGLLLPGNSEGLYHLLVPAPRNGTLRPPLDRLDILDLDFALLEPVLVIDGLLSTTTHFTKDTKIITTNEPILRDNSYCDL